MRREFITALVMTFSGVGLALAATSPLAVSPGRSSGVAVVATHCPSFSWGEVARVASYELVVYEVDDQSAMSSAGDSPPVLRVMIPGSAQSWTPSVDQCLERGKRYAWSVRALTRKQSGRWSPPRLFEVASSLSDEEFLQAFEVMKRYLALRPEVTNPQAMLQAVGDSAAMGFASRPTVASGPPPGVRAAVTDTFFVDDSGNVTAVVSAWGGLAAGYAKVDSSGKDKLEIRVYDSSGTLANLGCHFVAVGSP